MIDKNIILRDQEFITNIYNQFSPDRPLPDQDPVYVDCRQVRGDDNIIRSVGNRIIRSHQPTYQLYTGHRGGGKSTEILRLKAYLEQEGCRVIYFEADEDIDIKDVNYTDILLSCTRHIVEDLTDNANSNRLYQWLNKRLNKLLDLGLSEVEINELQVEHQLSPFAKITATLRTIPSKRQEIRKRIESEQDSFNAILNEFIQTAKENLKGKQRSKLVVIADNLDRIILQRRGDGSNNHDEIFIDQSENLKSLNCHLIYTVPISLVYSNRAAILRELYGNTEVLPMIMIRNKDEKPCSEGIEKVKEIIKKRVNCATKPFLQKQNLTPQSDQQIEITLDDLFETPETLEKLCQMTGGHVREIMLLMQEAINWIDYFAMSLAVIEKAIAASRNVYRNQVDHQDWQKLAQVSKNKVIINENEYRELLFSRCVLEYREIENLSVWHDVHPLIEEISEFKNAVEESS